MSASNTLLKNNFSKQQLQSCTSIKQSNYSSLTSRKSNNQISSPNDALYLQLRKHRNEYWRMSDHQISLSIVYRSMLYVKKYNQRSLIDDEMMQQQLMPHITISTSPTPINNIGQYLLKNGYVLVAFSLLMTRIEKQKIYYEYLMPMFDNTHQITSNEEEFNFYLDRSLQYIDNQYGVSNQNEKDKQQIN